SNARKFFNYVRAPDPVANHQWRATSGKPTTGVPRKKPVFRGEGQYARYPFKKRRKNGGFGKKL
ncbi:MAG: hypothetical protein M0Z58_05800, partial [Nitrospiraceae bacterium]|nr:hypothetical protein [Nitrospiraceae bacterium]